MSTPELDCEGENMKIQNVHVFNKKPLNPNVGELKLSDNTKNVVEKLKQQLGKRDVEVSLNSQPQFNSKVDITA